MIGIKINAKQNKTKWSQKSSDPRKQRLVHEGLLLNQKYYMCEICQIRIVFN